MKNSRSNPRLRARRRSVAVDPAALPGTPTAFRHSAQRLRVARYPGSTAHPILIYPNGVVSFLPLQPAIRRNPVRGSGVF
jgi:hypothetical protein